MTPEEKKEFHDRVSNYFSAVVEQPAPTESTKSQVVLGLVIDDFQEKAAIGIEHYGTMLMSHNGRDALKDLYQELIDACMYLRQLILERDGK